jgi:type II secretory pathway component PulF
MPSLKNRIQFYNALATLEEAGVPRVRALQTGLPFGFAVPAKRMARALQAEGVTLQEAMGQLPSLFSRFERNMVAVGEATGRMDTVFRSLAKWYEFVGSVRSKVISGLLYPLMVYHMAAVMIPFITTITSKVPPEAAIRRGITLIAIPWILLLVWNFFGSVILAIPGLSIVLLEVPLLGGVIYRLDCARFFQAYSMGLNSGMGMFETVELGAEACKNPTMRNRFRKLGKIMRSEGMTFTMAFLDRPTARDRSSPIPAMMQTGEETGRSAEMADRIARISREEAETAIERAARVFPTLIYLCIAAYIGYQIIQIFQQIYAPVQDLLK